MRPVLVVTSLVAAGAFGTGCGTSPAASATAHSKPSSPTEETLGGDAATWTVDPSRPPSSQSRSFIALVTRVDCNNGVTGTALPPVVEEYADRVVITFSVNHVDAGRCPANPPVGYRVELAHPIGDRSLIDGACQTGIHCDGGAQRWPRASQ